MAPETPAALYGGLVDWHTHMLADGLRPPSDEAGIWPGLVRTGGTHQLTLGGRPYRAVDSRTLDPLRRIADMEEWGVGVQVLSPPPYAAAVDGSPELARQQNAFLAACAEDHPGRFAVLGMVPWADPDLARRELDRLADLSGVVGVCLVAHQHDTLCDPQWADLWTSVADRGWIVFVHPADTSMCGCDASTGAVFGAGMPTATGRTAARMVASGLLDAVPHLRVLLAHAGGTFPAMVDRLDHGWRLGLGSVRSARPPSETARSAFWADSVVYGPAPLRLAEAAFGPDRLVYGSDYPFDAMVVPSAVRRLGEGVEPLLRVNGSTLLDHGRTDTHHDTEREPS